MASDGVVFAIAEITRLQKVASGNLNHLLFVVVAVLCTAAGLEAREVNICAGVANNIFLPHIEDCSKYYVCMNQFAVLQQCEDGFLFDARRQSCLFPDEAECLPTCGSALSSFCYDRTCTRYVLCYAGTPVVRECCDGLQYNGETDRCDFAEYVDCVDNMCTIFNDPTDITFLPSRASCERYFICMDGYANPQTCSQGLQFNTNCNCCDFPARSNCTIPAATKRNIQPFSRSPPRTADIKCPAEGAHFFPHPMPSSYYFCSNGRGIILECTPGLVYDPKEESCREPQNVSKARLD